MCNQTTLQEKELKVKYNNMKQRCSSKAYLASHPWYEGCTVSEEWTDEATGFDSFKQFCDTHFYIFRGRKTELDKDIKHKGNKKYSPETCLFVPHFINQMFAGSTKKSDNGLPKGVIYDRKTGLYRAILQDDFTRYSSERYETPEEAWEAYAESRRNRILAVAEDIKNEVPDEVYEALINFEIEITDD